MYWMFQKEWLFIIYQIKTLTENKMLIIDLNDSCKTKECKLADYIYHIQNLGIFNTENN